MMTTAGIVAKIGKEVNSIYLKHRAAEADMRSPPTLPAARIAGVVVQSREQGKGVSA
jgi:hypothetical protein